MVDFTAAMAGPTCAMLLGDFGAEVIKVEPPAGETSRKWGIGRFGDRGQYSGLYLALNRNKRSVTLDLKSPEGKAAAAALLAGADVVLENFKPGVADRLGIGYDAARQLRQDVVYCSISGFGQNGPLRDRPGLDQLLQAYVGHLSITGEPDRPSVRIGPSAIDLLTGAHAAFGILVALRERDRSGEGQRIDLSLYDTSVHLVSHYIADYTGTGELQGKTGPYFGFLAPYGMYLARDREFYLGIADDRSYAAFCREIGRDDLVNHESFATNARRVQNRDALNDELIPLFASRDAQEWVDVCLRLRIPTSLVEDIAEVTEQEQAIAREMLVDTGIGNVKTAGIPIKLERTPGAVRRAAPDLGADTDTVLASLRTPAGLGAKEGDAG